jgi:hypothetical protein
MADVLEKKFPEASGLVRLVSVFTAAEMIRYDHFVVLEASRPHPSALLAHPAPGFVPTAPNDG